MSPTGGAGGGGSGGATGGAGGGAGGSGGGGAGRDGSASVNSGVDPTKGLGTLTPPEMDRVCEATKGFAMTLLQNTTFQDVTCRISGITAILAVPDDPAMIMAACKAAYDACKAAPPSSVAMAMCPKLDPAMCMANVAEYEACLNELPGTVSALNAAVPTCDRVMNRQALTALGLAIGALGPACMNLDRKCPGALGAITMPPRP